MDENEEKTNWITKYAKITTRKAFMISSLHKLNPHEPEITKDLIAEKMPN